MVVRPDWLRRGAALMFSAVVVCAGLACRKSAAQKAADAPNYTISGVVTYVRKPLHYDATGVPTGIETDTTKFLTLPARYVLVRVFQSRPQTDPVTQATNYYWVQVASTTTGTDGSYAVNSNVLKNYDTFVELVGVLTQPSPQGQIAIVSDPAGVYSTTPITERPIYTMRFAVDGTTSTTDPVHGSYASGDSTLNINVGLTDNWLVTQPKWWFPAQLSYPTMPPTVAAGSSILAILDTISQFNYTYGNALPTKQGAELDLHYRPGVSVKRGSFVENNLSVFATTSFDGTRYHYYGAISGGGTVGGVVQSDDAYDLGVLYPLLARNFMFSQGRTSGFYPTGVPQTSLAPDLVLVEGFGDAMAAALLQSPYLPGSTPGNHYAPPRDIRDLSALTPDQIGPFSAPAITALVWKMIVINANITDTVSNLPTLWQAQITPQNFLRFYTLLPPTEASGTAVVTTDCPSLYTQLARLQEVKSSADNSDLAVYFPDTVLQPLLAPFNIPWTTAANAILPQYTTYWGLDPNSLAVSLPTFPLSMGQAKQINHYYLDTQGQEQVSLLFPNLSKREVNYASFALSLDATYTLMATTVPALPEGAALEVVIDGDLQDAYLFPAGTTEYTFSLVGNPVDLTTPAWHSVRMRILSPNLATPDVQVSVQLVKVD